jgi:hypothetical protein
MELGSHRSSRPARTPASMSLFPETAFSQGKPGSGIGRPMRPVLRSTRQTEGERDTRGTGVRIPECSPTCPPWYAR